MGLFKLSDPAPHRTIARLQALIWVLIYGGLLALVLGLSTRRFDGPLGWRLVAAGAVVAAAGVVLIYVRSRLHEER
jgi:hypothetical protein